jgi:hypothetical protein
VTDKIIYAQVRPDHVLAMRNDLSAPWPFKRDNAHWAGADKYREWVKKHESANIKEEAP